MKYGLTRRQRDTLDFIVAYQAEHRVSPSFTDIRIGLGAASNNGVHRLVHGLKERGYIDLTPGRWRSIVVREHPAFILPSDTLAKLYAFCRATGDDPASVVADAVTLHLDECALEAAA